MKCSEIHQLLSEYVDGVLGDDQSKFVDDHCVGCAACAEELAGLKGYVRKMSTLPRLKTSDDFLEKVHVKLSKKSIFERLKEAFFLPFKKGMRLELVGVAAAVMIMVYVFYPFVQESKRDMVSSMHEMRVSETLTAVRPEMKKVSKKVFDMESDDTAAPSVTGSIGRSKIKSRRAIDKEMAAELNYIDKFVSEAPGLSGARADILYKMDAVTSMDISMGEGAASGELFGDREILLEDSVKSMDKDESYPAPEFAKNKKEPADISKFSKKEMKDVAADETAVIIEEKVESDGKLSKKSMFGDKKRPQAVEAEQEEAPILMSKEFRDVDDEREKAPAPVSKEKVDMDAPRPVYKSISRMRSEFSKAEEAAVKGGADKISRLSGRSNRKEDSRKQVEAISLKDLEKLTKKYNGQILEKAPNSKFAVVSIPVSKIERFLKALAELGYIGPPETLPSPKTPKYIHLAIKITK